MRKRRQRNIKSKAKTAVTTSRRRRKPSRKSSKMIKRIMPLAKYAPPAYHQQQQFRM